MYRVNIAVIPSARRSTNGMFCPDVFLFLVLVPHISKSGVICNNCLGGTINRCIRWVGLCGTVSRYTRYCGMSIPARDNPIFQPWFLVSNAMPHMSVRGDWFVCFGLYILGLSCYFWRWSGAVVT
jgi:hypothetical protein